MTCPGSKLKKAATGVVKLYLRTETSINHLKQTKSAKEKASLRNEAGTLGPSRGNELIPRGQPSTSRRSWKIDGGPTIICSTAEPGTRLG